jgi:MFS transporter, SP family, inositol transporter
MARFQRAQRESWRNTVLAGLANYIDAGSIVAGAAGLALWAEQFHLSSSFVGIIGAFSSNAISAGVGALVGGWLCDQFGRKRIYQWDLLVYAFGLLWIIFAQEPWMLVVGYVVAGLAVGADVPASWTLIAETAPKRERGKHAGVAQLLWMMGPVIVLVMAFALSGLGELGIRIVFAHLLVVALVLWTMRRGMRESRIWNEAKDEEETDSTVTFAGLRELLRRPYLGAMLFLIGMYGLWNLMAGTNGFYLPYILRTVGDQGQAMSVALQAGSFALVARRRRVRVHALRRPRQPARDVHGRGGAADRRAAAVRALPVEPRGGFHTLAWILTGFVTASALLGLLFAPSNAGKSLEQIQDEQMNRGQASATEVEAAPTR